MAERPAKVVPIQLEKSLGVGQESLPVMKGQIGGVSGAGTAGLSTVVRKSAGSHGGTPQRVLAVPAAVFHGQPVLPATVRPITVLRTPGSGDGSGTGDDLTAQQSRALETFGPHIATLLLEVYRCKLCQFHSTSKALLADHMIDKHSLRSPQKVAPTPQSANSSVATVKVTEPSSLPTSQALPSTALVTQQEEGRSQTGTSHGNASKLEADKAGREGVVTHKSESESDGGDDDGFGNDADDNDNDVTESGTPSTVVNALELLMAIGHDKDMAKSENVGVVGVGGAPAVAVGVAEGGAPAVAMGVSESGAPVVTAGVPPVVVTGLGEGVAVGMVQGGAPGVNLGVAPIVASGVAPVLADSTGAAPVVTEGVASILTTDVAQGIASGVSPVVTVEMAVTKQQDIGLITSTGSVMEKAGELLTVNEADLSKTLGVSKPRVGGAAVEESRRGQLGAALLRPVPITIGLGGATAPSAAGIDLLEIANTASQSNPKATTITVLHHHGPSGHPPTAVQFKRSRKSAAIIPTGESLGITSPFSQRATPDNHDASSEPNTYRGAKRFPCPTCSARYKSAAELERHVQKKHQRRRPFLCEICGEALATRASVKYHVSRKHSAVRKIFRCGLCDYRTPFEARMTIHRATHQSDFVCELCEKTYVSAERLQRHYASPLHKNALNPLVCEHCGYSSKKRDNFLVHMRKHTGEKPYKCQLCEYASADGSTLKKHVMAKHSTIRPFKCSSCSFSCVDKKGLDIHVRKHTGERPYKCPLCLYAAKRRSALNVHMETHNKYGSAPVSTSPTPKPQTGKANAVSQPTEVANYETVGQVSATGATKTATPETVQQTPQHTQQQTPQQNPGNQQQQYTTMAPYQEATLVCPVIPAAETGAVSLPAKEMTRESEPTGTGSYNAQMATECIAKPVQPMWQNM